MMIGESFRPLLVLQTRATPTDGSSGRGIEWLPGVPSLGNVRGKALSPLEGKLWRLLMQPLRPSEALLLLLFAFKLGRPAVEALVKTQLRGSILGEHAAPDTALLL